MPSGMENIPLNNLLGKLKTFLGTPPFDKNKQLLQFLSTGMVSRFSVTLKSSNPVQLETNPKTIICNRM
jgi:hypothetical protein